MRWLTPDRLSIFRSLRAWNAISSTTSRTKRGTSMDARARPTLPASVMAIACGSAAHVVRSDLGADAILERRDDLAARGVVLGIGGEEHHHVERQPHRVALDLDVAFLQDVEQADLDLAGQVGQFVDREDAAIGARQQAEVHRQLAASCSPPLRRLDRIDVADHVGDGDVGRRELLDIAGCRAAASRSACRRRFATFCRP